jgi:glycosyltransferase involved in cell wall biosynthesis
MTDEVPIFSIILPTFNRSKFVGTAIQSVVDQSFKNFELIVVDDGSTDNTREIVNGFRDHRIKYFFKTNEERSIARNYGIERSSGLYINFLDSDDFFLPHHLQTAFENLREREFPELLHLNYKTQNSLGIMHSDRDFPEHDVNQRLIFENFLNGACFFIKRDIFEDLSFITSTEASFSEDWYLWLRLAARFPIHTKNNITVVLREHDERSLRTANPVKVERSVVLVIEELKKDVVFLKFYKSSFNYFVSECTSLVSLYYANVDKTRSVRYLFRALTAYPLFVKRKRFWAILKNLLFIS